MRAPAGFLIIALLSLAWNLMGDAAYIVQVTADLGKRAQTDPYQARLFAQLPAYVWTAYAVAVWGGTVAAVALLLRRAIASPLFALSLVAVIVQFSHIFLNTDILAVKGWSAAIFPAVILILAVAQFLFARTMVVRGVLR